MTSINYSEKQHLLDKLALLISSKDINKAINLLTNNDNAKVYDAAIQQGVVGLIQQNIKNTTATPELIEQLNSYQNNYKILNNFVDNEATNVLKKLKKEQIDVVVLKGFSLAQQVYSEPSLRPKTDIDILIRVEDKDKIKNIFESLGYSNPRGWEPKAIINQFSYKKTLGKGINVYFDIHLKISNSKKIENILNYNELLKSANTTTNKDINLINLPHALTHAVFHLLGHKASGDLVKLIWYYDIFLLIQNINEQKEQELINLISSTGLANLMTHTLTLTSQYFPSDKLTLLTKKIAKLPFDSNYDYLLDNTYGVKELWLTLKASNSLKERINVMRETMFPPPVEIYAKYGKHTKWPLSMLYLRRIIMGGFKCLIPTKKGKS